mmetsp:Transcript_141374/g.256965  ORF Transcript_141374/g.256965 Transcript_141374/m.256965 type:complete len:303 (-) Transcript_141374:129-1037(-)
MPNLPATSRASELKRTRTGSMQNLTRSPQTVRMLSILRTEAICSSAGSVSTPRFVATSIASSAARISPTSAPRGVDVFEAALLGDGATSASTRMVATASGNKPSSAGAATALSNPSSKDAASLRSAPSRSRSSSSSESSAAASAVSAPSSSAAVLSAELLPAERSRSSPSSASWSSSGSSTSAPNAARATAAASPSGSRNELDSSSSPPAQLSAVSARPFDAAGGAGTSSGSGVAGNSGSTSAVLLGTSAETAGLTDRAAASVKRCDWSFSRKPSTTVRTSAAVPAGSTSGESQQIFPANAS